MKSHSWHILYAIDPWLIYANDDIDGGSNTNSHLWVLNYRHEGKYHDIGSGEGGGVNGSWDWENQNLCFVCREWENHLSLLWVIALFGSLVLSKRGGLVFPALWKVCSLEEISTQNPPFKFDSNSMSSCVSQ